MYSTVWRNGGGWINCCKQTRFPINFNSFASRLLPGVLLAPGKKGNLRAGIIPPHLWLPIALTARSTAQYCTVHVPRQGFSISLGRHRRRENGREEKPSSFNHLSLHPPWGRRAGQKKKVVAASIDGEKTPTTEQKIPEMTFAPTFCRSTGIC